MQFEQESPVIEKIIPGSEIIVGEHLHNILTAKNALDQIFDDADDDRSEGKISNVQFEQIKAAIEARRAELKAQDKVFATEKN